MTPVGCRGPRERNVKVRDTIERYFVAIHSGGWESYISDDFIFVNGNFDRTEHGRSAYVEGAGRFFRTSTGVRIRDLVIDGEKAAVLARYDIRSPKGTTGTCDVAELLTVRSGKLHSSAIFFDTAALSTLMRS